MKISSLFSDGMILQRNKENIIEGLSKPNTEITLTINDTIIKSDTDEIGKFSIVIPPFKEGGPMKMVISPEDEEPLIINDVMFGDVYLLGGQSNMELSIGMIPDANAEDLATANNPMIRMFQVSKEYDFSGEVKVLNSSMWKSANTDTISEFSAIGYYFAKEKFEEDGVAVGLVHTAVGGNPIEALMSEDNLLNTADKILKTKNISGECDKNKNMGCIFCYKEMLDKVKTPFYVENTVKEDQERIAAWHENLDKNDRGLLEKWMDKEWSDAIDVHPINLPGFFKGTDYENYIGSLWLRKTVKLPKEFADKDALLSLGTLVDFDTTYVNGIKVGSTDYKYPPRRYKIDANVLCEGDNTITVRLGMDSNIGGAIPDMPYYLECDGTRYSLEGEWELREGYRCDKLEGETFFVWNPTSQFNSMIAPLKGYAFDAVLFYQGESNCGRPEYYDDLFVAMVDEWRSLFGKDIPFYVAELAYYLGDGPDYISDPFARVREVQRRIVPTIKNAYLIPICELGQYNELHPQNKKEVAHRFYESYKSNSIKENK